MRSLLFVFATLLVVTIQCRAPPADTTNLRPSSTTSDLRATDDADITSKTPQSSEEGTQSISAKRPGPIALADGSWSDRQPRSENALQQLSTPVLEDPSADMRFEDLLLQAEDIANSYGQAVYAECHMGTKGSEVVATRAALLASITHDILDTLSPRPPQSVWRNMRTRIGTVIDLRHPPTDFGMDFLYGIENQNQCHAALQELLYIYDSLTDLRDALEYVLGSLATRQLPSIHEVYDMDAELQALQVQLHLAKESLQTHTHTAALESLQ